MSLLNSEVQVEQETWIYSTANYNGDQTLKNMSLKPELLTYNEHSFLYTIEVKSRCRDIESEIIE